MDARTPTMTLVGDGGQDSKGYARQDACGLGSLTSRMRQQLIEGVSEFSKPMRKKMLQTIGDTIKDAAVADPDMCTIVKKYVRRSVALIWADLTAFVEMALEDSVEQAANFREHSSLSNLGQKPCFFGPNWWRAKILYCFLPFDKSPFGQAKDPFFWILTILSMLTTHGIRIGFYGVLLVCILMDDPDEFQLVQYITLLKGTFFLSAGVIGSIKTAVGYLECVHPGGCHTCDISGPAYQVHLSTASVDLFGSGVLVWAAFGCLRWSVHHGWHKVDTKDLEEASHHSHGGHLGQLFIWDLISIFISAILFWCLALADSDIKDAHEYAVMLRHQLCKQVGVDISAAGGMPRFVGAEPGIPTLASWDYHRAFLFSRIFYALMSTPFVLFKLPVLNTVLTHTTMTGYNKQGRCVIYCLPPVP